MQNMNKKFSYSVWNILNSIWMYIYHIFRKSKEKATCFIAWSCLYNRMHNVWSLQPNTYNGMGYYKKYIHQVHEHIWNFRLLDRCFMSTKYEVIFSIFARSSSLHIYTLLVEWFYTMHIKVYLYANSTNLRLNK